MLVTNTQFNKQLDAAWNCVINLPENDLTEKLRTDFKVCNAAMQWLTDNCRITSIDFDLLCKFVKSLPIKFDGDSRLFNIFSVITNGKLLKHQADELFKATWGNQFNLALTLIDQDIYPENIYVSQTLLMSAIDCEWKEGVIALLNKEIDVNKKNYRGYTPLHFACFQKDFIDIVSMLLHKSADLHAVNDEGKTPLHIALNFGVYNGMSEYNTILPIVLLEKGANPNLPDNEGYTPFLKACREGLDDVALACLKKGANFRALTATKETALHLACKQSQIRNYKKEPSFMVSVLLEKGLNPNDVDHKKRTPLHIAFKHGLKEVVKILIENGADLLAPDQNLLTPLTCAIINKKSIAQDYLKGFNFLEGLPGNLLNSSEDPFVSYVKLSDWVVEWLETYPICKKNNHVLEVPLLLGFGAIVQEKLEKMSVSELCATLSFLNRRYPNIEGHWNTQYVISPDDYLRVEL